MSSLFLMDKFSDSKDNVIIGYVINVLIPLLITSENAMWEYKVMRIWVSLELSRNWSTLHFRCSNLHIFMSFSLGRSIRYSTVLLRSVHRLVSVDEERAIVKEDWPFFWFWKMLWHDFQIHIWIWALSFRQLFVLNLKNNKQTSWCESVIVKS